VNATIATAKLNFQIECDRREAAVRSARTGFDQLRQEWAETSGRFAEEFKWAYIELQSTKSDYEALSAGYDRDLQRLKESSRDAQQKAYLEGHLLEDASIKGVGRGRKSTLASYGIETAEDLNLSDLESVPGFGPTLIGDLLNWKRSVLSRFVYNPAKAVSPAEVRALQMRYNAPRQKRQRTLRAGDEKLQEITARANRELADIKKRIEQSLYRLAHAEVDLEECRRF
jgi:DNA-binding helix-hairpin-helix protein with protein kinase domain